MEIVMRYQRSLWKNRQVKMKIRARIKRKRRPSKIQKATRMKYKVLKHLQ